MLRGCFKFKAPCSMLHLVPWYFQHTHDSISLTLLRRTADARVCFSHILTNIALLMAPAGKQRSSARAQVPSGQVAAAAGFIAGHTCPIFLWAVGQALLCKRCCLSYSQSCSNTHGSGCLQLLCWQLLAAAQALEGAPSAVGPLAFSPALECISFVILHLARVCPPGWQQLVAVPWRLDRLPRVLRVWRKALLADHYLAYALA